MHTWFHVPLDQKILDGIYSTRTISIKGQLISKRFFGVVDFLQKTNENKSTWGIIEVNSNLFVRFLEETDDPKNHFEINWP